MMSREMLRDTTRQKKCSILAVMATVALTNTPRFKADGGTTAAVAQLIRASGA